MCRSPVKDLVLVLPSCWYRHHTMLIIHPNRSLRHTGGASGHRPRVGWRAWRPLAATPNTKVFHYHHSKVIAVTGRPRGFPRVALRSLSRSLLFAVPVRPRQPMEVTGFWLVAQRPRLDCLVASAGHWLGSNSGFFRVALRFACLPACLPLAATGCLC